MFLGSMYGVNENVFEDCPYRSVLSIKQARWKRVLQKSCIECRIAE